MGFRFNFRSATEPPISPSKSTTILPERGPQGPQGAVGPAGGGGSGSGTLDYVVTQNGLTANGTADDTAAFVALVTLAIANKGTIRVQRGQTVRLVPDLTLPTGGWGLTVERGGYLKVEGTVTGTPDITAGRYQIFTGPGQFVFGFGFDGGAVFPQWFGALGNDTSADDLPGLNKFLTAIVGNTPDGYGWNVARRVGDLGRYFYMVASGGGSGWVIQNILNLHLRGVPGGTVIFGNVGSKASPSTCIVNTNNTSHCRFEYITVSPGANGWQTYGWLHERDLSRGRYTTCTRNKFQNIRFESRGTGSNLTKIGIKVAHDGRNDHLLPGDVVPPVSADYQCDLTEWVECEAEGDQATSEADINAGWNFAGFYFGTYLAFANCLNHHLSGCTVVGWKYGVATVCTNVTWEGGTIQTNGGDLGGNNWDGADLYFYQGTMGACRFSGFRSEDSGRLIVAETGVSSPLSFNVQVSNVRFYMDSLVRTADWIKWGFPGTLILDDIDALNPRSGPGTAFMTNTHGGTIIVRSVKVMEPAGVTDTSLSSYMQGNGVYQVEHFSPLDGDASLIAEYRNIVLNAVVKPANGTATPSVRQGGGTLVLAYSTTTNVTNFLDGSNGQDITVQIGPKVTIKNNSFIKTKDGVDYTPPGSAIMKFQLLGGRWCELLRQEFTLSPSNPIAQLVTALGGNSRVRTIRDYRGGLTMAGTKVIAWDDYRDPATYLDTMTTTPTLAPTLNGSGYVVFDSTVGNVLSCPRGDPVPAQYSSVLVAACIGGNVAGGTGFSFFLHDTFDQGQLIVQQKDHSVSDPVVMVGETTTPGVYDLAMTDEPLSATPKVWAIGYDNTAAILRTFVTGRSPVDLAYAAGAQGPVQPPTGNFAGLSIGRNYSGVSYTDMVVIAKIELNDIFTAGDMSAIATAYGI